MEKFHYQLPGGHELTLPRMENLSVGLVRSTRRLSEADQIFTMLEALLPESDLVHVDELTGDQFKAFIGAWRDGSSVGLGESSAS